MKRSFGHDWDYVERDPGDFEEDVIVATIQSPDHVAIIKVQTCKYLPFLLSWRLLKIWTIANHLLSHVDDASFLSIHLGNHQNIDAFFPCPRTPSRAPNSPLCVSPLAFLEASYL